MKEEILEFIKENAKTKTDSITMTTDLYEEGILDSFGIIALLAHLQEEYNVSFSPEDLQYDNYQTVDKISQWLEEQLEKTTNQK